MDDDEDDEVNMHKLLHICVAYFTVQYEKFKLTIK